MTQAHGFGLLAQRIDGTAQRVLVLSDVAGQLGEDRWFESSAVEGIYEALRLNAPPKIGTILGQQRERGYVVRRKRAPHWSLTPEGRELVRSLIGRVDVAALQIDLKMSPRAEFMHAEHAVIAPAFAPPKWLAAVSRVLERFPFDHNVFCMARFHGPEDPDTDPLPDAIETVRKALQGHGLALLVANQGAVDDDVWANVGAYMWASRFGIAFVEDQLSRGINLNVVTEIGSMLVTGRRCAILKDSTVDRMPTDLVGQIYKPVDLSRRDGVSKATHEWAASDLGLGRCPSCPPISGAS